MAIWVEAEGFYNLLIDNCFVNGNKLNPGPAPWPYETNFRNGIVIDIKDDPRICTANIAIRNDTDPSNPLGPGNIEGVIENGILLQTREASRLSTSLNPNKFPYLNIEGLSHLHVYGVVSGCGIKVNSTTTDARSKVGIYSSLINLNTGGPGIGVYVRDDSKLEMDVQNNQIYTNEGGGIQVEARSGICEIDIIRNNIHDTEPDQSQGYAGILLKTVTDGENPSVLKADLNRNMIHHLQGHGLHVVTEDNVGTDNLLEVTSSNDRIYRNLAHGVWVEDSGLSSCTEINAYIQYLTSIYNEGMGIRFDDSGHQLNAVNSIFYYNTVEDVDTSFAGNISYSDWQYGLSQGGAGHGNNCISGNPSFLDLAYHLQWSLNGIQSPCVDVGDNNGAPSIQFDMEGDQRIIDGDNIPGAVADMGADELKHDT